MLFFGNPAPDAKIVVLYGNCQIPFLGTLLAAANEDLGFLCVLNHAPPGQEAGRPSFEQISRCCLYLEQYDSQIDELAAAGRVSDVHRYGLQVKKYLREHFPDGCPKIVFPSLVMTCMWPFAAIGNPRNVAEPGYVWGRYPYGNRLANEVVARGLQGASALEAYMQLSAERLPHMPTVLERAKRKLEKRDTHCDVKIADYVWARFREKHLFLSYAHVRPELVGELALRLLIAMQPFLVELDGQLPRARLLTAIEKLPDMDVMEEPIEQSVAQELGLGFYEPEMRFRWYTQQWTFSEYMTNYLDNNLSW